MYVLVGGADRKPCVMLHLTQQKLYLILQHGFASIARETERELAVGFDRKY